MNASNRPLVSARVTVFGGMRSRPASIHSIETSPSGFHIGSGNVGAHMTGSNAVFSSAPSRTFARYLRSARPGSTAIRSSATSVQQRERASQRLPPGTRTGRRSRRGRRRQPGVVGTDVGRELVERRGRADERHGLLGGPLDERARRATVIDDDLVGERFVDLEQPDRPRRDPVERGGDRADDVGDGTDDFGDRTDDFGEETDVGDGIDEAGDGHGHRDASKLERRVGQRAASRDPNGGPFVQHQILEPLRSLHRCLGDRPAGRRQEREAVADVLHWDEPSGVVLGCRERRAVFALEREAREGELLRQPAGR